MSKPKGTIPFVLSPTIRTVYDRAPKPKPFVTPRREYAFMRNYAALLAQPTTGTFGPSNSGVIQ